MSDVLPERMPPELPVAVDMMPVHRRAVFSSDVWRLTGHHPQGPLGIHAQDSTRRRRLADDSLRLVDDLTNRPMDSLYADSLLDQRPRSAVEIWGTRCIVFLICIVVGISGSVVVQRLHSDPRKQQRDWYISRIEDVSAQSDALTKDLADLRSQINALSDQVGASSTDETLTRDELGIGSLAVEGPGIAVQLTNPVSASNTDGKTASGTKIRVVSDDDLQWYVSQLWGAGAEAIAVNGCRLGVQTSIRRAGGTILVDLTKIESPYIIQAIGDKTALRKAVDTNVAGTVPDILNGAGIHPQISNQTTIRLEAAESKNLSYARSVE
ncbi:DUF881 domain-containing protein [Bifidobacterium sp. UBA744]|uniref:DUF881 domain-containing protein n=1 Tax=Bifidobacterium sp. UBA744 TaxID=1946112 RepID=UPI0025C0BF86|nr:DUF881 domain-containing protein [Bifidobacterium sp. UBA744]